MNLQDAKKQLAFLVSEGEKDQAVKFLIELSESIGYQKVIFELLEPALEEWGKLWMKGKISLAFGYVSGKVAEGFYIHASEKGQLAVKNSGKTGKVILGNIEDDFHPLGRRLVSIYSKAAGWEVIDLGNDIPAEEFVNQAIKHKSNLIAVSAMMYSTAKNILEIREILDKKSLSGKIKLAVGGAVFKLRKNLVKEVGGNGTTEIAINAPALFTKLLKEAEEF